jgi:hypothetical protein
MAEQTVTLASAEGLSPEERAAVDNLTAGTSDAKQEGDPYYCPGCGRRWKYLTECSGRGEAPHQPTLVVSVDELLGDPANYTAALPSE